LLQRFLGLYKEGQFDIDLVKSKLIKGGYDIERTEAFLEIFINTESIDFSDMIAEATSIIEQGGFSAYSLLAMIGSLFIVLMVLI